MKALLSTRPGNAETLKIAEIPSPEPGAGEVRIAVETCGLNYPDVLMIEDRYQMKPPRPFSPGGEVSGRIDRIGDGVTGFAIGDRVACLSHLGGLAEQLCVEAASAVPLPDDVEGAIAAMLLTTYATAWHALVDRAACAPGDVVMVLGAGGGVGLAAVEIAAALGATVVACASSTAKLDAARAAGAVRTLRYPSAPLDPAAGKLWAAQFKEAAGPNGANIVYDPVGGTLAQPALRALAWEGRYLVVGFTAGIPALPLNLPLLKGCSILGVFMGEFAKRSPAHSRRNFETLVQFYRERKIQPSIAERFPLERAKEALARLAAREAIGKQVVTIG